MKMPFAETLQRFTRKKRVVRVQAVAREVLADLKRDDVPGLGAEIAYHAIFAIPPLIILVVTIAAAINQLTGYDLASRLVDIINERAPDEIRDLLLSLVDGAIANVSGGLASFGVILALVLAIWSGSNGVSTLIKAFNRAYGVTEDRSFIKLKSISIGLTILVAVLVNSAFFLLVFGSQVADWAQRRFGLGDSITTAIEYLRTPLAFLFVVFVLALLYFFGPNVDQSYRWLSPGSLVATVLWALAAFGFQIYLRYVNPGSAYGALGSIVVLMFFLYISGIICVLGAEINAIVGERFDPDTIEDLAAHPEKLTYPTDLSIAMQFETELKAREMNDQPASPDSDPQQRGWEKIAGIAVAAMMFVGMIVGGLIRRRRTTD